MSSFACLGHQMTRIIICQAHLPANPLTIPLIMYSIILWNNFLKKKKKKKTLVLTTFIGNSSGLENQVKDAV